MRIRLNAMLKNLFVFAIALLAALGGAELTLRIMGIPKFYRSHSSPAQFRFVQTGPASFIYTNSTDTQICFTYDGNPRDYFDSSNTVCHTTNKWGFRGAAFDTLKTGKEIRIGVLGDSFTFGEGVKDEDTYCQKLQTILSEEFPEVRIQIFNFGIGGYNTVQEYELFTEFLAPLKIDVLVLAMTLNDAEPKLFYFDPNDNSIKRRNRELSIHEGLSDPQPTISALDWSHIYQSVWKIRNDQTITEKTIKYYTSLYMDYSESRIAQQSAIRKFYEVNTEDSMPMVTMLFPVFHGLKSGYPFEQLHNKIRKDFGNVQSPTFRFVDLRSEYTEFDGPELWVHPTDQHPNEIAHEIAARKLAIELTDIIERKLLN